MLFNSYIYFIFFFFVLLTVKLLERNVRLQHLFIVGSSAFFYGYWDYRYLALIFISIITAYISAIYMARPSSQHKKAALSAAILINLSILCIFKYYNFFSESIAQLLTNLGFAYQPVFIDVLLPVGISFYTFQIIAYCVDVYAQRMAPCRSLLVFSQFVLFFPQLVAGPIERAKDLIPQLRQAKIITFENVAAGVGLIILGLFKKCFVGDSLGMYVVDPIFSSPGSPFELILAVVSFAVQIYCDFSGYCDVAIGSALCLNVRLNRNFRAPYLSLSIQDFWRKWHVTLSYWFRDYVYIPLGGNQKGEVRTYCYLFITMLACGLWHGASYIFILWGAYHGLLLVLHRMYRKIFNHKYFMENRLYSVFSWATTFIAVLYGWLIFRSPNIDSFYVYNTMLFHNIVYSKTVAPLELQLFVSFMLLLTLLFHLHQNNGNNYNGFGESIVDKHPLSSAFFCGAMISVSILLGNFNGSMNFIYFQF